MLCGRRRRTRRSGGGRRQEPYTSRSNYQTGQGELPKLANEGDVNFPPGAPWSGDLRAWGRVGAAPRLLLLPENPHKFVRHKIFSR